MMPFSVYQSIHTIAYVVAAVVVVADAAVAAVDVVDATAVALFPDMLSTLQP